MTRVQVLIWLHELTHGDRRSWRVHPGLKPDREMKGVFSLRSCVRPNPIGVTQGQVVMVNDDGLSVSGLDAKDGSLLIDIKASCSE